MSEQRRPGHADRPGAEWPLTKIVATIGPASESPEMVRRLIEAGVAVFRLNFSHGSVAEHARRLATIRAVAGELGLPVAVLGDLCGPKIRVGRVSSALDVASGQDVLIAGDLAEARLIQEGGPEAMPTPVLPTTYPAMIDEVEETGGVKAPEEEPNAD